MDKQFKVSEEVQKQLINMRIFSNEIPNYNFSDEAVKRRMIIIPFKSNLVEKLNYNITNCNINLLFSNCQILFQSFN